MGGYDARSEYETPILEWQSLTQMVWLLPNPWETEIGEVISTLWTVNDSPGLQELKMKNK